MAEIIRLSREDIEARLRDFEERFGLTSSEFYRRWLAGEFKDADREEYLDWVTLCIMARLHVPPVIMV